ncbi:helix-turn-helix transcriptional regulator [Schaalia sp. 19OD2882]|uniref:helix-turn-helix domain-containing protein n=1 Tax=Schaalia sp. 19OD2882 TaxID=2794089 RepID=UPI001C1E9B44|nr:helix-turn-helix domain-containing protein [Schaalia sp. 19OD2882]QWW20156.1 helix-turn-helix transcriptional regulator [Schaalia sp. 19OD2882]
MVITHIGLGAKVAKLIDRKRTQAGKSVVALSNESGIPRATLIRRLNTGSGFTVEELELIANTMGTTAAALVTEAENTALAASSGEVA